MPVVPSTLDPLGRSLRMDDGDLALEAAPGRPPAPGEVEGLAALAQALTLTVETQIGTDPLNVGFGFDFLAIGAGAHPPSARKEFLRMHLVRAIASDRRVKAIRELFFDDEPRYFELHPGVDPERHVQRVRASRRFTAFVVLEARTGEDLTLTIGGLGA